MSITSNRTVTVSFSGDITATVNQSALANAVSPGEANVLVSLTNGFTTVTAPVISGIVVTGLTIVPPAGNTNLITLKGITGDTGVPIHKTDPTSIALDTTFTSLGLVAVTTITGVRLVWS
jgi:hypothetical protein